MTNLNESQFLWQSMKILYSATLVSFVYTQHPLYGEKQGSGYIKDRKIDEERQSDI